MFSISRCIQISSIESYYRNKKTETEHELKWPLRSVQVKSFVKDIKRMKLLPVNLNTHNIAYGQWRSELLTRGNINEKGHFILS